MCLRLICPLLLLVAAPLKSETYLSDGVPGVLLRQKVAKQELLLSESVCLSRGSGISKPESFVL